MAVGEDTEPVEGTPAPVAIGYWRSNAIVPSRIGPRSVPGLADLL